MFMLLLAGAVQAASVPATPPTPVVVVAPKKKDVQICRPVRDTFSRIGTARECHTAAQWRSLGENVDSHELDRFNSNTRTTQNEQPR